MLSFSWGFLINGLAFECDSALKASGQEDRAEEIIAELDQRYQNGDSAAPEAEKAWFYLVTKPMPDKAFVYAEQAEVKEPTPLVQRILG